MNIIANNVNTNMPVKNSKPNRGFTCGKSLFCNLSARAGKEIMIIFIISIIRHTNDVGEMEASWLKIYVLFIYVYCLIVS